MIRRIDHVALVVRSIDEAVAVYSDLFGLKPSHIEDLPEQGVKAAIIPVGDTEIELLEPIDSDGGVAKFLERRGEGLHHLCLEVDDVDQELGSLEAKGAELIDREGRKGLAGKVAFLHPKAVKGALVELAQKAWQETQ